MQDIPSLPHSGGYIYVGCPGPRNRVWRRVAALMIKLPPDPRIRETFDRRVCDFVSSPDDLLLHPSALYESRALSRFAGLRFHIRLGCGATVVGEIPIQDHEALDDFRACMHLVLQSDRFCAEATRWRLLTLAKALQEKLPFGSTYCTELAQEMMKDSMGPFWTMRREVASSMGLLERSVPLAVVLQQAWSEIPDLELPLVEAQVERVAA